VKVIVVDTTSSFKNIGISIVKESNGKGYAIVSDNHQYGEPIFVGTKNQCMKYIAKL
jgi:hypothetical protein